MQEYKSTCSIFNPSNTASIYNPYITAIEGAGAQGLNHFFRILWGQISPQDPEKMLSTNKLNIQSRNVMLRKELSYSSLRGELSIMLMRKCFSTAKKCIPEILEAPSF